MSDEAEDHVLAEKRNRQITLALKKVGYSLAEIELMTTSSKRMTVISAWSPVASSHCLQRRSDLAYVIGVCDVACVAILEPSFVRPALAKART